MGLDSAKLINLAAREIKPSQIAAALGVTPGRMTQILKDERIIKLVEDKKAMLAAQDIDTITSLEELSSSLLTKMGGLIEDTESLGEAVRAYETIEKMQAVKKGTGGQTAEEGLRSIIVQVPVFVQQALSIVTNPLNEITSVEQRSMATMPTSQVHKMIKRSNDNARQEERGDANHNSDRSILPQVPALDF